MMKLVGSETHMERHDLIAAICGMTSLVYEDPDKSDVDLAAASQWLRSRGNSIEGGTSEIQLDVLAKHILPEEPGTSPAGCVDAQLSDELDLWARSFAELRCGVVVFVWWRGCARLGNRRESGSSRSRMGALAAAREATRPFWSGKGGHRGR
jgi:hypothetical protein